MVQSSDRLGVIHQNLMDTGCNEATLEACMEYAQGQKPMEMLPLLAAYRTELLEQYRTLQKQIDRLDYLVYQIKKNRFRQERML